MVSFVRAESVSLIDASIPLSKWWQLEMISRLRSSVLRLKNCGLKVMHLGYVWHLEKDLVLMAMW